MSIFIKKLFGVAYKEFDEVKQYVAASVRNGTYVKKYGNVAPIVAIEQELKELNKNGIKNNSS